MGKEERLESKTAIAVFDPSHMETQNDATSPPKLLRQAFPVLEDAAESDAGHANRLNQPFFVFATIPILLRQRQATPSSWARGCRLPRMI